MSIFVAFDEVIVEASNFGKHITEIDIAIEN